MPAVTRKGDSCTGHGCFPARPSTSGSPDVFVNGIAVHRQGDSWARLAPRMAETWQPGPAQYL